MLIIIIINIIIIAFDNPWVRSNSVQYTTINICNYFINICILIERLMKIISNGFLYREKVNEKLTIKRDEFFDQIITEINDNQNKKYFDQISEKDKMIVIQKTIYKIQKQKAYLIFLGNIIYFFV